MLSFLRTNLEFIITFMLPFLVLGTDAFVRFGLWIDVADVGADMALCATTMVLTHLIDDLRLAFTEPQLNYSRMVRGPDLLIGLFFVVVFGSLWLLALVFVSETSRVYQVLPVVTSLRVAIVLGIGIGAIFTAAKLLYELMTPS